MERHTLSRSGLRADAPGSRWSRSRALALACLVTGFVGEALFRDARVGLNFSIFVMVAALVHATFTRCSAPVGRRLLAAAIPTLASVPVFFYDSAWARFFSIPLTFAWLFLVPRIVEHGLAEVVFHRLPERAAEAIMRLMPATVRTVKLPFETVARPAASNLRVVLVGLGIGVPSAAVFVALFSFDAKFSHALSALARRSDTAATFTLSALGLALLVLVLVLVEELRPNPSEKAEAIPLPPYRVAERAPPGDEARHETARTWIPASAWALVLAQVSAVFALYDVLHARDLFSSHEFVRTAPGVTYAKQLHSGFYSLLIAIGLAVGLVVLGHTLYADRQRAIAPGARKKLALSEAVLASLAIPTLASCGQRLVLYVEAYGQTYLRLGVTIIVVATVPLLVLTIAKSLRPSWRDFGAGVTMLVFATATTASFFDADAHVARVNVERGIRGRAFDADYVGKLGSRALVGLADAKPSDPDGVERWLELVSPIAHNWERHARGVRGFRRESRCDETLGPIVCATPFEQISEVGGARR